ncbi:hypothetical protein DLAC_08593 [Tieghemostelium lacteum]|uniref:Uncharacterized protein n=1 Tax=Tieghemostelium lacteum TaxID=361077 RepID=A0A151Z7V0_TIELA|nr:hypothetical protein DLAC_08593 [Tieghemostelium lacteum]|eukprot:KYQ90017.1 hypothetical protein DLAC_08593 [Tieghemostelium lacteum]
MATTIGNLVWTDSQKFKLNYVFSTDLIVRVEINLTDRYKITIEDQELSLYVIAYFITQKVIDPQDTPLPNSPSFGILQSYGLLTITPDNKVVLPLIYLRKYAMIYNHPIFNSLWDLVSLLDRKYSWEEWESFNCYLEIIKHQSHHILSPMSKPYSLGEYYKGALFFPPSLANDTFSTEDDTLSKCSFPTKRCPEDCDIDQQCQAGTAITKNPKRCLVDMFYNAKLNIGTTYFLGNTKHPDGTTTLKSIDHNINNYVRASEQIEKKTINKQQIKFIPIVYSNHFVTSRMLKGFNKKLRNLKQIKFEPNLKITEAIIVCRGTGKKNVIQPHDGFYYPFQDFIYPRKLEE